VDKVYARFSDKLKTGALRAASENKFFQRLEKPNPAVAGLYPLGFSIRWKFKTQNFFLTFVAQWLNAAGKKESFYSPDARSVRAGF